MQYLHALPLLHLLINLLNNPPPPLPSFSSALASPPPSPLLAQTSFNLKSLSTPTTLPARRTTPSLHPGRIIPIRLPTNDRPEEFRRVPAIAVCIVDRESLIERARPLPAVAVGLVYDFALVYTADEPVPVAVVGGGTVSWGVYCDTKGGIKGGKTRRGEHLRVFVEENAGEEVHVLRHSRFCKVCACVGVGVAVGVDPIHFVSLYHP